MESERPLPRICRCENGGTCREGAEGALECVCGAGLAGPLCAAAGARAAARGGAQAAVLVPVLLVLLLALGAAAAWFVIRKRPL